MTSTFLMHVVAVGCTIFFLRIAKYRTRSPSMGFCVYQGKSQLFAVHSSFAIPCPPTTKCCLYNSQEFHYGGIGISLWRTFGIVLLSSPVDVCAKILFCLIVERRKKNKHTQSEAVEAKFSSPESVPIQRQRKRKNLPFINHRVVSSCPYPYCYFWRGMFSMGGRQVPAYVSELCAGRHRKKCMEKSLVLTDFKCVNTSLKSISRLYVAFMLLKHISCFLRSAPQPVYQSYHFTVIGLTRRCCYSIFAVYYVQMFVMLGPDLSCLYHLPNRQGRVYDDREKH